MSYDTTLSISDYEKQIIQASIDERWAKGTIVAEEVEVEIRLYPDDRDTTACPAMYWLQNGCHFLLVKTEDDDNGHCKYRSQFFYSVKEQYGTGIPEYDDLGDCILGLLRLQADHQITKENATK